MSAAETFSANSAKWSDMQDHMPFLFEKACGNVMEIGVRGGMSTSALLAGIEAHGGHLWSVDINPCKIFDHPQWTFTQADSIAQKETILAKLPSKLDVLFVDGDHSYEGCLSDLQTYGPRADLILIHDCLCPDTFPGVRKASEEYAASIDLPLVIRDGSYGLGVIEIPAAARKSMAIAGWMTAGELAWLAEQASRCDLVVEVGCYQGRSTRALGDHARGTVFAVDDWNGLREDWWIERTPAEERETLFERFTANVKDLLDSGRVKVLKMDHANISLSEPLPAADMVFIDGDHSYESVKRDICTWLPLLTSGGLMCGHDFNQVSVQTAVYELLPGAQSAKGLIWAWEKP